MAHIILIDSDVFTVELLAGFLRAAGHEVFTCQTAEQAVELCVAGADAVVSELLLPEYNAVALLQYMQSFPALEKINVVLYTTISMRETKLSARHWQEYGVDEYICKLEHPPQVVAQRLKRLLV